MVPWSHYLRGGRRIDDVGDGHAVHDEHYRLACPDSVNDLTGPVAQVSHPHLQVRLRYTGKAQVGGLVGAPSPCEATPSLRHGWV